MLSQLCLCAPMKYLGFNVVVEIQSKRIRVLRIIARMNVGGPAIQIAGLMKNLDKSKFEQLLVTGFCSNEEIDYLFTANDVQADDWIIKQFRRPLTFIEAFKEIKNDKKVRRKVWEDGSYIDKDTRLYSLIPSEFLCNDWEVVE